MVQSYIFAALVVFALMTVLWIISLGARDASIVDRFWGMGFVLIAWALCFDLSQLTPVKALLVTCVSIWGLRLSLYIHLRNRGHGEDKRYVAMRKEHGDRFWWYSYLSVFLLQGLIMLIVSAPVVYVLSSAEATTLTSMTWIGVFLWTVGFIFEAGGDWQLTKFKSQPENQGRLLATGLWSLTRHPNYFGDALQWWGLGCFALSYGLTGWLTLIGPLLMTLFIRKVSGVDLLEKDLKNSKPGYAEYIASTPPFLPKMSFWIGLVFFCAALLWGKGLFANSIAPEQELPFRTIFFQVKDPKDGKLLSNGTEKIVVEKGLISKETLYYLGEDKTKVIQSETCTFDLATLRPVTYSFLNSITGEKVSINLPPPPALDGQVEYQASTTKPASPFKIKWNESMAIGKTLHHIIVRAWNDLLQGKSRAFQLYVPMKQDQYSFRVIKADKDKKYSAEDTVLISLELDNWALRQLAPSMNFYYSSKSKVPQLVRYEGPTTVVLDDDTDKKVTIDFQYEI